MSLFNKLKITKPICAQCRLDKGCKSPRAERTGTGEKKILLITGSLNETEERTGRPLVGWDEADLKPIFSPLGVDQHKDCWRINAVRCRPKEIDKLVNYANYCRPSVTSTVKELAPRKIILFGDAAIESFYGDRPVDKSPAKFYGLKLWDSTYNAWVFPVWCPELVCAKKRDTLLYAEYKRALTRAITADETPLKKVWNQCHSLIDYASAIAALENCLQNDTIIAIDFETTGLTMYRPGHKTVSFGWANAHGAWAVPVQHPYWKPDQQKKILTLVQSILKKRKIGKIAHNISFEYQWAKQVLQVEPRNIFWDTQLAAHVLDNRSNFTKLKFQSFINWGIEHYNKEAEKYISSPPGSNFNNMLKMPVDALLKYNALDTLYTYELYKQQSAEMPKKELSAYKFLHEGAIVLCEMSFNGIRISESFYLRQRKIQENKRDKLVEELMSSPPVAEYRRKNGKFDYNSPKDVQELLVAMGVKLTKKTKTGFSVDEDVLSKLAEIPIARNIIKIRKVEKVMSTYIDAFLSKQCDGFLHPSFSLATARTYRSSSSNPNFQAIPKRDPDAKKATRSGMIPREGRVLGEMDFSGAEITTSIYYHKDPKFIKYQTDKDGGDMHRDAAANLLKVKPDAIPKEIRQATKGGFTFAQFYGSYYKTCAVKMWGEFPLTVDKENKLSTINGVPIDEYMVKTFGNYSNFEGHVKEFENKFWNEWFPIYTKWKKQVVKQHTRQGFIETFFGLKFRGLMGDNQCTNYPIQSTSFHLLLYTAVVLFKELKRHGLKTLIIGQIHDSIILDIPTEEVDEVAILVRDIVTNLHNKFSWMILPMGVDFEVSRPYEEGGSFSSTEPYKYPA